MHLKRLTKIVFSVILLIFWLQPVYSQNIICNYCGKGIKGSYLQIDGKYFHPEHFICFRCGKRISGKYNKSGNNYFHPECYSEAFIGKCAFCKKPINGEYIEKEGKKYHQSCFEKNIAVKCDVCGETISGEYFVDYFGNKYHAKHQREFNECENCRRLICNKLTGGGVKLPDGRDICSFCNKNAVKTTGEVNKLSNKVYSSLKRLGFEINIKNVAVVAVDKDQLKQAAGSYFVDNMKGYCLSEKKEMKSQSRKSISYRHTIYVLNYAPHLYIESTIAHEMMHVWITENTKGNHSAGLREGSCNYLSYVYVLSQSGTDAEIIKKILFDDPSKDYGDGFRSVYRKVNGKPLNYLFTYLRQHSDIW